MWNFDDFNDNEEDEDDVPTTFISNTSTSSPTLNAKSQAIIKWTVGFLLFWQAKHFISNSSMNVMAKFLSALFNVLGYFSPILAEIGDSFYTAYKELCKGTDAEHAFTKYVVCPKCNQLYKYDDCKENEGEVIRSRTCSYVEFPYHPHLSRREPCGFPLLKTIEIKKTDRGSKEVYCYQSLQKCLRKLFKLEEFVRSCSTWKQNQWNNGRSSDQRHL